MRENGNRVDGCRNTEPYCDGFIQLPNFVLGWTVRRKTHEGIRGIVP